ncbi:MAG: amino acid ABC transporter ATP-binding protein [Desulfobulbaceae bacterium]|nr:amino acid ABC transporter ATP-binding protein [Desulfobulbaceae bacterium]
MATTATPEREKEKTIASISGLNKWFNDFHVLKDINIEVAKGEKLVICGPSGSGKSTLIRCINRLKTHQQGKIIVDGIELTSDVKRINQIRRETGMLFQNFNLFPHMTVLENLTLSPCVRIDVASSRRVVCEEGV